MSKAVTVARYDEDRSLPVRSLMVVKAWSIKRFQRGNFVSGHVGRAKWLASEVCSLKADIIKLGYGGGTTGSVDADAQILSYIPNIFG